MWAVLSSGGVRGLLRAASHGGSLSSGWVTVPGRGAAEHLRFAGGSSSSSGQAQDMLAGVYRELEHALDGVPLIQPSAEQAYLEHDPSERGPKHEYVRRYQAFARQQLDSGLGKYERVIAEVGSGELPPGLRLLAAESMLARDRIAHSLAAPHKPSCPTPDDCTCLDPAVREELNLRSA
mmetsp:Transcript_4143/g.10641  ORF Transcript_4143/g.10641 Transcript_4143/m.10641 type:complete len:179 (+) Transcript_4143:308-844(+)